MPTTSSTNHLPKGPVTILGQAYVGEVLIARPNGVGDEDGINYSTVALQWLRNGVEIAGATGQTYEVSTVDVGARLSVRYSYVDYGGTLEVITSDPEPVVPPAGTPLPDDDAPYNPLMVLGDAIVGESLVARPNAVTDQNGIDQSTVSFQWLRDGTPIPGATQQVYAVVDADIGAQITVQYSYSDYFGTSKSLTSNPKAIVAPPLVDSDTDSSGGTDVPSDLLNGTSGNDVLHAASGLKRINGMDDTDTVFFQGNQSGYTLRLSGDTVSVSDHSQSGLGTIMLDNVELIDFGTEIPAFQGPIQLDRIDGLTELSQSQAEDLIELYIAYFNRAPDAVGLNFWGTAFANGHSLEDIAGLFAGQDETRAHYRSGTSHEDFAATVYENVLGRTVDQAGLDFWSSALSTGAVTRDEFILRVLEGARSSLKFENGYDFINQQIADRQYLETKIDIGAHFAVHRGLSDVAQAEAVMALYDGSVSSVSASVSAVDAFYSDALNPTDGAFLLQVIGVLDSPYLT